MSTVISDDILQASNLPQVSFAKKLHYTCSKDWASSSRYGLHMTLVTLEADDDTHMAVGGGTDQYVVDADERLIVGGQEGIYPLKLCVGVNSVLKAAKTFAEFGKMDKSLAWEKDRVVEPVCQRK